jgi:hypothetical protein
MKGCEKYKGLLMGLMDGELTPEENQEIHDHMIKCDACRQEYEALKEAGSKIEKVSFVEPQDEILKKLWKSPYNRLTRYSGIFLVFGGWLALLVYALIEILKDSQEPAFPRIATVAVFLGFFILLFTVIRERIKTYKTDPYKEVER